MSSVMDEDQLLFTLWLEEIELDKKYAKRMTEFKTVADFLAFCKENGGFASEKLRSLICHRYNMPQSETNMVIQQAQEFGSRQIVTAECLETIGLGTERFVEICKHYADIVRVGKLTLNETSLKWDVSGNKDVDVKSFCEAFQFRMRHLNSLDSSLTMDDQTLAKTCYWVCKGLSINYVLVEVLTWLKSLLGMKPESFCRLGMEPENVDYFVDVLEGGCRLRVGLMWRWTGNVIEYFSNGQKLVRGTLQKLHTEFACPPLSDFKPQYRLSGVSLKKSRTARAAAAITRKKAQPTSFTMQHNETLSSRYSIDPSSPPAAVLKLREISESGSGYPAGLNPCDSTFVARGSINDRARAGWETPSFALNMDDDVGFGLEHDDISEEESEDADDSE